MNISQLSGGKEGKCQVQTVDASESFYIPYATLVLSSLDKLESLIMRKKFPIW
jgi:hypothetical protein